jgi:hypothetical protein
MDDIPWVFSKSPEKPRIILSGSKKHIFPVLSVLVLAVSLVFGTKLIGQKQIFKSQAKQDIFITQTTKEPEFAENEILIKVKKEAKNIIKENASDTGVDSLNKTLKANRVEKFTRLSRKAKTLKKMRKYSGGTK